MKRRPAKGDPAVWDIDTSADIRPRVYFGIVLAFLLIVICGGWATMS